MKVVSISLKNLSPQAVFETDSKEFKSLEECMTYCGVAITPNRVKAIKEKIEPFVIKTGEKKYSYFCIDNDLEYEKKCFNKVMKKIS